ncbi:MAG: HlyD family efflux transporter periplasmic adaptor subunit [Methylococcaceae bacterium]|nr:HlyD family efflux transporter periplasmic adaptor subunit [Methylococcaceae bacterium]MCI0733228.1 HlyD family efflux transporter periplasmic adaptor subunit [Methylococcaceae bacterium]
MNEADQKLRKLSEALEDHGIEGIELLSAEPSKLIHWFIVLMLVLVVTALGWTFIGRADVIVTAAGAVAPDSEVKRFYAPIQGELVDIFIAEGQPVSAGDVLARLNARGAVEAATNSQSAELELSQARREFEKFPEKQKLMLKQAEALEKKIEIAENLHLKRVSEGMDKLAESQRAKLQEARARLEKTLRAKQIAGQELAKLQRLEKIGGASKNQVDLKQSEFLAASADYSTARAQLGELDFQLSEAYSEEKTKLESSDQELTEFQIRYKELQDLIKFEKNKVEVALRSAENKAESAKRVNFENIDEDNFLRIIAPVSGVITEIAFTQPGDKIEANTPLGGIAPEDSKAVVNIEIQESDRAFLKVGQAVKLKFNAFPYQRYGFIEGTLEYLSPSTQVSPQSKSLVYKGRVSLAKDYFEVSETQYPIRYGMQATAEIVVRKRRLIDLALDPFRQIAG